MYSTQHPKFFDLVRTLAIVFLFSAAVNLLFLAGPLYMLQVYDRVLSARSEATLVVISVLVMGLYVFMGYLDFCRARILGGQVERWAMQQAPALFRHSLTDVNDKGQAVADLDTLRQVGKSPVLLAALDLVWMPFALIGLAMFHPSLAYLATAGAAAVIMLAMIGHTTTKGRSLASGQSHAASRQIAFAAQAAPETVLAQGMGNALGQVWSNHRSIAIGHSWSVDRQRTMFSNITKTLRLMLQSAVLGLGAYQVLQGNMSGGAMIAGSILLGRALTPVEQIIGGWGNLQSARQAWGRLNAVPPNPADMADPVDLPNPNGLLTVTNLAVTVPTTRDVVLQGVSFTVNPGEALGVLGPSGSGKSSLLRALSGLWPAAQGDIRLDGATLDQYGAAARHQHVGLITQNIALFPGNIADNIARFDPEMTADAVHKAAKAAGVHDLIIALPNGYNTQILAGSSPLSGGQMQRIALARALYNDPSFLILDEPNAALDAEGEAALNTALIAAKARGAAIVIMSHRPSAISVCDNLLILDQGKPKALGPKDAVLRTQIVSNSAGKAAA